MATVSVSIDVGVPEGTGLGLKLAVTPDGKEDALRATEPMKPLSEVTVIVDVSEAPGAMVRVDGEAEMPKSGGGVLVTVSV